MPVVSSLWDVLKLQWNRRAIFYFLSSSHPQNIYRSRAALSSTLASSHVWLLAFKLIKLNKMPSSVSHSHWPHFKCPIVHVASGCHLVSTDRETFPSSQSEQHWTRISSQPWLWLTTLNSPWGKVRSLPLATRQWHFLPQVTKTQDPRVVTTAVSTTTVTFLTLNSVRHSALCRSSPLLPQVDRLYHGGNGSLEMLSNKGAQGHTTRKPRDQELQLGLCLQSPDT